MSMSEIAVRVDSVSKRYRIGKRRTGRTFREAIVAAVKAPFLRGREGDDQQFFALREVSFEISRGEVVGIIGRNGAGKSTLLKILSRITEPTSGQAEIYGRVGSLLEVGTGFHPELTGRENVYLNGAILGMKRYEIDRKFGEIVDFAEVERFVDTPVKHYSSGMYVRLAFAVAAHLETEILIVDEVLAVGDSAFQRKCLGKIGDVASHGRTVLFVSHNMAAISSLCSRAIELADGELVGAGPAEATVARYLAKQSSTNESGVYSSSCTQSDGKPPIFISKAWVTGRGSDVDKSVLTVGADLEFNVHCKLSGTDHPRGIDLGIGIDDSLGHRVVTMHSTTAEESFAIPSGTRDLRLTCRTSNLLLAPGTYAVKLSLESRGSPLEVIDEAFGFEVVDSDYFNNGGRRWRGSVLCPQAWSIEL